MFDRRKFLKYSGLSVVGATSTLILGSCQSKIIQDVGGKITVVTVNKVYDLLVEFIQTLELDDLKNFPNWISGLGGNDQDDVNDIESMLERNGFNGRRTAVYKGDNVQGTCIYGVENKDDFNLCAPYYTPGANYKAPMVEGNALSALLSASKSPELKKLVKRSGTSLSKVLVPVIAYQEPSCNLYESSEQPFIYQSSVADITIEYKYDKSENRGITKISIESPQILFKDFAILDLP